MIQEGVPSPEKISFRHVSSEEFILSRDMLDSDLFAFLTPHTGKDYESKGTKLFLSEDGKSGFGITKNNELISVFSLERQRGRTLVALAKKHGVTHLSCMGEHLLEMYSEFGFSPVEVTKWDNQFAPKNWSYERFGTPNIYEMRLVNVYTEKYGT